MLIDHFPRSPKAVFTAELNRMGHKVMRDDFMLADAIALNSFAFLGEFDKSGQPYIEHLLTVMGLLRTDDKQLKVVAVCHDFIEDIFHGDVEKGAHTLYIRGYSDRVVDGVVGMTKVPGELDEVYQLKVLSNPDSLRCKYRDIEHNSDLRRIKGVRQKDFDRHMKYMAFSYRIQEAAKQRGIQL